MPNDKKYRGYLLGYCRLRRLLPATKRRMRGLERSLSYAQPGMLDQMPTAIATCAALPTARANPVKHTCETEADDKHKTNPCSLYL